MKNSYFVILLLILFSVFLIWWLPGPRAANDFSFISNDWLKLQFDFPRVWNERGAEGLGEYGIFILSFYPINLIFGMLAQIGLNFEIWERLLVLLFILLGSTSIWKLLDSFSLSNKSKFIGSLFYLINTYPILLIDGGQISIALAYGLFPLAFLQIQRAIYSDIKKKVLAGLVLSLLGFFDIRFIYIIFLLFLLKILFDLFEQKEKWLSSFFEWIKTGVIIGLVVLGLNFFWVFANLKTPVENDVLSSFTKISSNFLNIGHPILVISPHWYKNIFGEISKLRWEFIFLPLLVFLAPILRRKDKNVAFWLVVAGVSVFLAKGGGEPVSVIYPFLHSYIPGFSFFRDSTKFFFLVSLSYAILLSVACEELLNHFKDRQFQIFFLLFITSYLLYLIRPVLLNQMTGMFSIQLLQKDFQSLADVLQKNNNFGRVFWIPGIAPLAYSDLKHPTVEAARVFNRIPFAFGTKGSYETFNFLREAPYMGEIFDISGISYIAYPYPDARRGSFSADEIKYYYTFLDQLTHLPWVKNKVAGSNVPLLQIKNHQDKIFIVRNSWIVFGSDEVFKESTKSAKLKLSNNAIIFAEREPEEGSLITKYPEAKIVLNKKTIVDLLATFIPKHQIIFLADRLSLSPNNEGWWKNNGKDLIAWRDFLESKYGIDNKDFDLGGGWSVGEGEKQFTISDLQFTKGKILMARVLESSRGGELSFYQNQKIVGKISTKVAGETSVRWFEVGALSEAGNLVIKTKGDINVVNALALTDPLSLSVYKKKAVNLFKQVADYKPENTSDNNSSVAYQKINQTKYKINVTNLTLPEIIVFSSAYHPLWKLNGESSIPVYGFLNGFRVDKNGEYNLEFGPQQDIYPGLLVTGITSVIVLFLVKNRKTPKF